MMKKTNDSQTNEAFLADWLSGILSDEELKQRVSDNDYHAYQKIKASLAQIELQSPNMDANYAKIREKIAASTNRKKSKVQVLFPVLAIAAALMVFFGLYQLFAFSNSNVTGIGTTSMVKMSDNSIVILNANSEISYPALFKYNRKIKLEGEAMFNVEEGTEFKVKTSNGDVTVIGTRFNVISAPGFFEVTCFDGRVMVSHNAQTAFLSKGDAVRFVNNNEEKWIDLREKPSWIAGESTFRNTAFEFVINQFENQYGYEVQYPNNVKPVKFSGTFPNADIETALQSICLPLNLKYEISGRKISISE